VVIFFLAALMKDTKASVYAIWLSVFGALVSLYQHYLQMGGTSTLPCPASGEGDCAKRFIFEFGYITFPLIAFTAFVFIIILMLYVRRQSKGASVVS
jgi:disulfide bond formation protein DsbB